MSYSGNVGHTILLRVLMLVPQRRLNGRERKAKRLFILVADSAMSGLAMPIFNTIKK